MLNKLTKLSSILLVLALMTTTVSAVLAAPVHQEMAACDQDYNVQADDWLSKLAEKEYGDPLAYPAIVEATNSAAQKDDSYATITNPDLIEIGWKLCVPATAEGMMADEMMAEEGTEEEMMAEEGTEEEMMADEM